MPSAPEPVSWLLLERYALGELTERERAEVEARLAASESDRACLAEILADKSELPALVQKPLDAGGAVVVPIGARSKKRTGRWLAISATLCAAAAALLIVLREQPGDTNPAQLDQSGIKGADVSLRLISDQKGLSPTSFSAGERFKVELSCPPKLSAAVRLFVRQGGEVFEPLPRAPGFSCGNLVPWPGAFMLDGDEPADVCVYWGSAREPTQRDFDHETSCSRLTPH